MGLYCELGFGQGEAVKGGTGAPSEGVARGHCAGSSEMRNLC